MSLIRKTRNVIYFDTETLSLNSHESDIYDNPYNYIPKLISTQVLVNNEITIEKEWEIGERKLIENILHRFDLFLNNFKNKRYMPIVTYNGLFDFMYILGRMRELSFSNNEMNLWEKIYLSCKNIDLIQYDKGFYVSLNAICRKYNIESECEFNGKDVKRLYHDGRYNDIEFHGKDDVKRLYRLIVETPLGDKFFTDEIGVI